MTTFPRKIVLLGLVAAVCLLMPRSVAAAEILDCTTGCSELFQGLYWTTVQVQPAGTGVIDSFLRVQQTTVEQGMNTDYRPLSWDEKTDPNYTRDIQLGEIRQVTFDPDGVGGEPEQAYYELLLDINEPSGGFQSLISLIGLELCVSSTGQQYNETGGGCDGGSSPGSTATSEYNMDLYTGANSRVDMDFDYLGTGSGGSDMFVYVPVSMLGSDPNDYLYLWSQFGRLENGESKSQDGFEEWAAIIGTTDFPLPNSTVPEPASLLLLGTGLALTGYRVRRRRSRKYPA
jgi:hypothetical protein